MTLLNYGQPEDGIIQMAYVVDDLERHRASGFELVFPARVPTGGRVGYVDTKGALPGFLELIELSDATEAAFTRFYATSLGWDGGDPVRPFA